MTKCFLVCLFIFLIVNRIEAGSQIIQYSIKEPYRYIVAGHVYGEPSLPGSPVGIHPPFKGVLTELSTSNVGFCVLTGDIVRGSHLIVEWASVYETMKTFNKPVFISPGNHEFHSKGEYIYLFEKTHKIVEINDDLFLFLNSIETFSDPNQLKDVEAALAKKYRNIFVFFHNLLWVQDEEFSYLKSWVNSHVGNDSSLWQYLKPLFSSRDESIYIFSGDLGVKLSSFYANFEGIHLIGSGMAGNPDDNYLNVSVSSDTVGVDVIPLDKDKESFSLLENPTKPWLLKLKAWMR